MLTRRGVTLLICGGLLWAVGRVLGLEELYVAAAATAALLGAGALSVVLTSGSVATRRSVTPTRLAHEADGEVTVELRNDSWLAPATPLLVADAVPSPLQATTAPPRFVLPALPPGRTATLRYAVAGAARGRYRVGPLQIRVRDPFGATERVRRYAATDAVIVHPRVERLAGNLPRGTHHGSGASDARRLLNVGDEFHTMREYVTGDDLRHVHWPSTAHRSRLMVRQHELPWHAEATVFCDTRARAHHGRGPHATFERSLSVAASLLCHLADHGYRLRLMTDDDAQPGDVATPVRHLDRLAAVECSVGETLAPALTALRRSTADGLLVAVLAPPPGELPLGWHPDVRALLRAGRSFAGRVAVVVEAATSCDRGARLSTLLAAAGWRTTRLQPEDALPERWQGLVAGRRPLPPVDDGGG